MRRVIVILVLLAVVATLIGVINLRREPTLFGVDWRIKKRLPTKEVQIQRPRRSTIVQTVTAPGTIELIDEAKIASQTMGQVESVNVEKGDLVKTGDLLVKLDDEDAKARLESTEARIDRLKEAIKLAEADLKKAEEESHGVRESEATGVLIGDGTARRGDGAGEDEGDVGDEQARTHREFRHPPQQPAGPRTHRDPRTD